MALDQEMAPSVAIDAEDVTIDNVTVGGTATMAAQAGSREPGDVL